MAERNRVVPTIKFDDQAGEINGNGGMEHASNAITRSPGFSEIEQETEEFSRMWEMDLQ